MLREAGLTTRHEPELALLDADDRAGALSGARAIIAGTRPLGEEEFALAPHCRSSYAPASGTTAST